MTVRGAGNLAITHANVIDATGAPLRTNVTLLIAEGRIRSMGDSSELSPPADAIVMDATGKFVIPGLWDMHVHWYEHDELALLVQAGLKPMEALQAPTKHPAR